MPVAIAPGQTQPAASGQHGISQGVPSDRHTTGYRVTLYLSRTLCSIRDRGQGTRLQPRDTKHDCAMEATVHDCNPEATVHNCATEATVHDCNPEATAHDCATEATAHDCATEATVHNCNLEATAYDCATKTKVTHRCLFLPTILFQICLNYFFAQKIRYISPLASLRHGIDSASMPSFPRARLLRHRNGRG
jgi:hypothetical protein